MKNALKIDLSRGAFFVLYFEYVVRTEVGGLMHAFYIIILCLENLLQ
jgi:hypothetical protein